MIDPQPVDISIVIPVHNNPGDLDNCLSALIAASTAESEIIIVADASTDNTASIAAQKVARLSGSRRTRVRQSARNYGARHSTGDILFFVDADVVVVPGAVGRVISVSTIPKSRKYSPVRFDYKSFESGPDACGGCVHAD